MDLIKKHFPELSELQLKQFGALGALYKDWNQKINVVSRRDIDNLYVNHILFSLSIAKFVKFTDGTKILDAGTGGGFPGLPLAILFPNCQFLLVDSVGKKLKVIDDIASQIGLTNINTMHSRVEDIKNVKADFVLSRAVARLDEMWNWTKNLYSNGSNNDVKNGLIYLKGGDISDEIPNNTVTHKIDLVELINEPVYREKALVHISKE